MRIYGYGLEILAEYAYGKIERINAEIKVSSSAQCGIRDPLYILNVVSEV